MAKGIKFPRSLYKSPGTRKLVSKRVTTTYDKLVVRNEKEYNAAMEMGYIDSFHDALFVAPLKESKPVVLKKDDDY
jgi:hypothetical protein